MSSPALARLPIAFVLRRQWHWFVLVLIALVPRLYLLRVFDVELSQDGFDAVNTLNILQSQGAGAVPRALIDRFILHPTHMLLLLALRIVTPASVDFYFAARLLSAIIACVAIVLMFELARRAYGEYAAWASALLLAFAPSFLWESVAILSSTLFLALYLAVLLALVASRYRLAALLALVSALTRYEGVVLIALVFLVLFYRDWRERQFHLDDWLACLALALAFPLTLIATGWLATGNALEFIGAQSMASIWLRFLAPGDFLKRAGFFLTQYAALFPAPIVWLGIAGAAIVVIRHRARTTALLLATSVLYLVFFQALVWFNYTTLEVRFLMYPGLPLLVFAGVAVAGAIEIAATQSKADLRRLNSSPRRLNSSPRRWTWPWVAAVFNRPVLLAAIVLPLLWMSYEQGVAGMQFVYNMMASQREVADELANIVPPNQKTNLMVYTGHSGALDLFGRQRGLQFSFTDFRFAPDDQPEQFLMDRKIQFVVYPVGNAFAQAKYPFLARFETQTHSGVTFQPLTQFSTSLDNQLYSIWSVTW